MRIAVLVSAAVLISGCGSDDGAEGSQAAYEAEQGPRIIAAADLPADLRSAAGKPGNLPCRLPRIPGEFQSHKVDRYSHAFLSPRPYGEVAGFYRLAAELAGHDATVETMPGVINVAIRVDSGTTCVLTASDGGTHRNPEGEATPVTSAVVAEKHD
ncbi:hypothetical protein ABS767_12745 [Sphingomonas sp. ST-64]|uniref:Lipoprotein n=1 Tax=Sphingomonas plantiphila TaxID=3163295 RepID=A0ABW8YRG2_9SPHN